MNYEIKKQILDKIKEYRKIFLFRHIRNDGDCVGATKGLKEIILASFPEKEVYIIDAELAMAALGEVDGRSVDESIISDIFSHFCVGK